MQKIVIIGGPTSSGKTKLGLKIAKKFNGELINADSRQLYKYLDIGTNKGNIIDGKIEQIPIHLVNIIQPDEQYNVFKYKKVATSILKKMLSSKKLPIIVGGTGLYIDALLKNYRLNELKINTKRDEFEGLNVQHLQALIPKTVLDKLNQSDINNPRRLIRMIEQSKENVSLKNTNLNINYDFIFLYPKFDWNTLKGKIENRVEEMFKEGVIEETLKVLGMGFKYDAIALQGIGYRQIIKLINKEISLAECINQVKTAHKQYAKRQRTWFEGVGRGYDLVKGDNETLLMLLNYFLNP